MKAISLISTALLASTVSLVHAEAVADCHRGAVSASAVSSGPAELVVLPNKATPSQSSWFKGLLCYIKEGKACSR